MAKKSDNCLIISDTQVPFQHGKSLEFCVAVKKEYKIPDENVYHVGDEVDQYFGGLWKRSPEARHTANSEIKESIDVLKEWYDRFPKLKLCTSNHGSRWMRKAADAEIPSIMMRKYQEVIEAPPTWQWAKRWNVFTKQPFLVEHGDDWGGTRPHFEAALWLGMSVAIGHHHSVAGVERIETAINPRWGLATGSLINFEEYAFEYARKAKKKPCIGVGVVLDSGQTPIWLPLE